MEQEKNLQAAIPAALLTQAQQAAQDGHITVDELVKEALSCRLAALRRQKLYAYGEAQVRQLGIKEEDVDRLIHEFREEERTRERQNPERGH